MPEVCKAGQSPHASGGQVRHRLWWKIWVGHFSRRMTLDLDIGQSKKPKILMKNSIVYYEADTNSLVDTDTFYENFTKGPF